MKFSLLLVLTAFARGLCFPQTIQWQEINGIPGFFALQEGAEGKLFGARGSFVYASTDQGLNWFVSLNYATIATIFELKAKRNMVVVYLYDPRFGNSNQIYWSTDNGLNWSRIFAARDFTYYGYMISDSGYMFAIGDPWVVRYDGVQWMTIGNPFPSFSGFVYVSEIDDENTFYLGTSGSGMFVSTDYGTTWNQTLTNRFITAINTEMPDNVIVGTLPFRDINGGVFISTDRGATWRGAGLTEKEITSIAVDSSGRMYASTNEGIFQYDSDANDWNYIGPINAAFDAVIVSSAGVVTTTSFSSGIFHSTDHGVTWFGSGPRGRDVFTIIVDQTGTVVAGTLGASIFRSPDGGTNWHQVAVKTTNDYIFSLAKTDEFTYAGTNSGIFRSSNAGETWMKVAKGVENSPAYSVVRDVQGQIFTGTDFGVYRSTDQDTQWQPAGLENLKIFNLAASNDGKLFAATDNGDVYYSTDGGAQWISSGVSRNDIQTLMVSSSGNAFAGVYGGILCSTNGGVTWEEKRFANSYVNTLASFYAQTIYAGTAEGMYVSDDNGTSWRAVTSAGLNQRFILSLTFDALGNLYAGTYRGGVYKTAQPLTSVEPVAELPATFQLFQNYPNPFNPVTVIRYSLIVNSVATLKVFDVLGREVATLVDEKKAPGVYTVSWDASGQPSGVYLYRLQSGKFVDIKKMILVK